MSHDYNGDPDRDPVDVLAEEFADRLRRGEHPSVSDYTAAHPDHAEQLRELLPAVAQMEFLKRFRRTTGDSGGGGLPDRFGDFRIVRELGRGGMGVVFEAVQESLGRPVALKVLSTHTRFDKVGRERFVREAQAAARLHHTNIVPVFGVGEQDGLPYYVMQLIRGQALHTVIRGWRLRRDSVQETARGRGTVRAAGGGAPETGDWQAGTGTDTTSSASPAPASSLLAPENGPWQFAAEVACQAADALHYAHKQGVLHRDVKPANLLLDPTGRVWITDFGLAKLVEQEGLTASGDILGTLQYIPPECLAGEADPRSDVYGLGATLYELLTLQPPYAPDNPARLVRLVADTEPVPPRQISPSIPRDLETIVLKAMARDPDRRYASAAEMAHDLRAFLEDRPIRARRQTALGRGWRWCRRNPAVAVLAANMTAALVLAGVVGWVGYANTRHALQAEAAQLAEAQRARADAERAQAEAEKARTDAVQASVKLEANLRMSLKAFEEVFEAVDTRQGFMGFGPGGPGGPRGSGGFGFGGAPGRPPGLPGEEERAAVLEAILAFYDEFAQKNATNPRLQLDAGRAHRRVAEVQAMRGNGDKAALSVRRAVGLLEGLARTFPEDRAVKAELVQAYLVAPPDTFPDQEGLLVWAHDAARELGRDARPHLAGSIALKLAMLRDRNGDQAAAEEMYREALAGLTPPHNAADPRPPFVMGELVTARSFLASLLADTDRPEEARRMLEESLAEFRGPGDRPQGPGRGAFGERVPRELLAAIHLQLAAVCDQLGDQRAAEAARAEANRLNQGGFGGGKGPNPLRKNN